MAPLISRHRGCKTVSKAKLQKAFSALLISQEPGALYARLRDPSFELERREFCCTHGGVIELLSPQNGSAPGNTQERALTGCLAPEEWIRSHPVLTLALLSLLLLLILALVSALAAVSVKTPREPPVIPLTPDTLRLLACPKGWVGYRGLCYFFSRDHRSWDQAQALCSELGASLAMPKDMDMRFLSCLSGSIDLWLGVRRQDQGLQWVDGSSFSSSVEVLGDGECVPG